MLWDVLYKGTSHNFSETVWKLSMRRVLSRFRLLSMWKRSTDIELEGCVGISCDCLWALLKEAWMGCLHRKTKKATMHRRLIGLSIVTVLLLCAMLFVSCFLGILTLCDVYDSFSVVKWIRTCRQWCAWHHVSAQSGCFKLSHQISAAARSVLHCMFSRLELVGWVLDRVAIQLSLYLEHV